MFPHYLQELDKTIKKKNLDEIYPCPVRSFLLRGWFSKKTFLFLRLRHSHKWLTGENFCGLWQGIILVASNKQYMWAGKDFYLPGLESKNKQCLRQGSGRSIASTLVLICLLHVLSHSSPRGSGRATLWQRDGWNCLDKERISSPQPSPLSANWKLQRRCDPKMLLNPWRIQLVSWWAHWIFQHLS